MAKKHKKNKKWIARLVFLLLFIAAAVVAYLVWDNYFRDKKTEPVSEQGEEQVEPEKKVDVVDETAPEKPKVVQYDGENPNDAAELSGVVTYVGVVGDNLMIRVNIDQYLEDGECTLALLRGGNTIYNSVVRIVDNVTTATCGGFDIPLAGLGNGKTDIVINLSAGGKTGVIRGEAEI